ncbi:hypothetical protein CWS35_20840 [Bradyrhizobium sp. SK17]|nr:hypothetical protein CWS35_20840 [Bradyrhizobium sp. SK17]
MRSISPQTPSCPALCRASTFWFPRDKDVDGRDKPGHDERGGSKAKPLAAICDCPGSCGAR